MCNICIAYFPLFQFWLWCCQYWHWYCRYGGILVKAMMELKKSGKHFSFCIVIGNMPKHKHCYWQYAKTQRSSEMRQQSPNLKLSMTHSLTDTLTDRGRCWEMLSHLKNRVNGEQKVKRQRPTSGSLIL